MRIMKLLPRSRALRVAIIATVISSIGLVLVALVGNDYRVRQESRSIPVAGGTLDAVLALPPNKPAHGLVVMIHGDGPVDATDDGFYTPWFEAAADAGFASLSWSKPGVGGSSGNWLDQSMKDRAVEVSAAIDWAKGETDIPSETIVLWGASQAGWVVPAVAAERDDIEAIVLVSPAINWMRQGRYNLLAELDHENDSAEERRRAIQVSNQTRKLLKQDAGYHTYRATSNDPDPMGADRWSFVRRNYASDATHDLAAMSKKQQPVLLMLGKHDRNVDIDETDATYAEYLGNQVTVERFDAVHSMVKPAVDNSETLLLVTAVFWPRALFADGVLATYRDYLRDRRSQLTD